MVLYALLVILRGLFKRVYHKDVVLKGNIWIRKPNCIDKVYFKQPAENLKINEKNVAKNLYTQNIPDPDILIRTGNRKRLSNFLLWQAAYAEIFFEQKLWPDFNGKDYDKILNIFKKVKRNYGKI